MKKILQKAFIFCVIFVSILGPFSLSISKSRQNNIQIPLAYAEFNSENNANTKEEAAIQEVQTNTNSETAGYLNCDWNDLGCHGINFLHWVFVVGGNVIVGISAIFMDYFLGHSIQSSSYRNAGLIEQGWEY